MRKNGIPKNFFFENSENSDFLKNFINRNFSKQFAMHLVDAISQMTKYTFFDSKILQY